MELTNNEANLYLRLSQPIHTFFHIQDRNLPRGGMFVNMPEETPFRDMYLFQAFITIYGLGYLQGYIVRLQDEYTPQTGNSYTLLSCSCMQVPRDSFSAYTYDHIRHFLPAGDVLYYMGRSCLVAHIKLQ